MRELYSHSGSFIHQLDARVKVLFTLAFLLFLNLTPARAWPAYILFLTIVISITLISRLGLGFVQKRALLALPFVIAAVPLIFSGPDPQPLPVFNSRFVLPYSQTGIDRFISIAVKAWLSIQASILLAATTRFVDLMTAFQQLKAPKIIVTIVGLMWRYLFLMIDETTRLLRARASRSAAWPGAGRPGGSLLWRAQVTGGMAGSLFLRSIERSERVYAAMLSRGYNGELADAETSALSHKDRRMIFLGLLLMGVVWILGLFCGV